MQFHTKSPETINCGAETCASEPGVFCEWLGSKKHGQQPICRFPFAVVDAPMKLSEDRPCGWVMRSDRCKAHFCIAAESRKTANEPM